MKLPLKWKLRKSMSVTPTYRLERKLERELKARSEAERLLEVKSRELYQSKRELEDAHRRKEVFLQVLNRFALALTGIDTEEDLVWYVAREVVAKLGFDDCVFYIYEPDTEEIVQRAAIAAKNPGGNEIINPLRIPIGKGITGTVAATREPVIVNDVSLDPKYVDDVVEPGSEICVPVEHDGVLIGVLDSEDPETNHYTSDHLEILQTVASYAAAKIAERRAHVEVVRRSAELEEKVVQLTVLKEELEVAKEKAEETSALKSRFVATISHEIRTPLAGMLGSLDLLQDEQLDGKAAGLLEMSRNSGQALQTLLNDVIDFARSEAGTLQYEPTAFSVTELIGSVQGVWQPHLEAKGFEFHVRLNGDIKPSYWGDPARIRQILNNYMSNAVKYAGKGLLELTVTAKDGAFRFSLKDQGPGLSKLDQDNLFKEFSRVGASKRQIGDGAGLGLAICKQVAELMGGKAGVESDGVNGSTFWLEVELKPTDQEVAASAKQQLEIVSLRDKFGRRPRILVAEDVPTNQTIIRMTLEAFDCRVTIVSNGVEAVEAARRHVYDLIFMDIAMPEMDGTAATKRIYELLGEENTPPIFALTAHGMDEDREEFARAGMSGIVTKPFDRADLYVTIHQTMIQQMGEPVDENNAKPGSEAVEFDAGMVSALLENMDSASREFLLTQCVADITGGLKQVAEGLEENDPAKVAEAAHRLKSVTGTFGLTKIQQVSGDVNDLFRSGEIGKSYELAKELRALLPQGILALKEMAKSMKENL